MCLPLCGPGADALVGRNHPYGTEVLAFLDMTNGAHAREDVVGATITPIGHRVGSSGAWWRTGAASQGRVPLPPGDLDLT